jgi:NAD-dependent epimerase/dehydratase family protein
VRSPASLDGLSGLGNDPQARPQFSSGNRPEDLWFLVKSCFATLNSVGGFIGSHLVNQLVEAGEAVRVLEEPGADVRHLPLAAIQLVRGDIRRAQEVRDAVRDCRQFYHLAANSNLWTRVRSDLMR